MKMKTRLTFGLLASAITFAGCSGDDDDGTILLPPDPTLRSLAITPGTVTIDVGATQQLTVTGTYDDGSTADLTADATFTSSERTFATVSAGGLVTGVAEGTASIVAEIGTVSDSVNVTVNMPTTQPMLTSIAVTPATADLAIGGTQQLTVTGTFDDGSTSDVTSQATFTTTDMGIASVDASGLVTAAAAGMATITADVDGNTDDMVVDVTAAPTDFVSITFDDASVSYTFTGFGGAEGSVEADPAGGANQVGQVIKSDSAEVWAGVTISTGANESVPRLPIDADNTRITARIYSPDADIPVRIKIEDASDNTVTVETEVRTTMANAWEELTFDFANQAMGTAALDVTATYNKISVFFNFGTDGATAGEKTYHIDDIIWIGGGGITPGPTDFTALTFDEPNVNYVFTGFGGANGMLAADPGNAGNQVGQIVKSDTAETWAGVTISTGANESVPRFPVDADNTRITVRVYSPAAGVPVRVKIEDASDNTVTVESEVATTMANAWETLTIDFANQAMGTAAVDVNATYNKMSVFFNFGTDGMTAGEQTYYLDDVTWIGGGGTGGPGPGMFTSLTFDDPMVAVAFTDFGGAVGTLQPDPTGGTNQVARIVKTDMAELWAGTTISTGPNDSVPRLPIDAQNTRITVRAYSPDANTPIRVKIEDASDPTVSVEAEVMVTAANTWETVTIDFADEVSGTAAVDVNATYDKMSVFFNFGTTGAMAGEKTYFLDDVTWIGGGGTGGGPGPGTFTSVTFDDPMTTYAFTGFGDANGSVAADPAGGTNQVAQIVKSNVAELWAGVTISTGPMDSVPQFPVDAQNTRITIRAYSPDPNTPVRVKIEDSTNAAVSVEAEVMITAANTWETLTIDFANQVMGTAAVDVNATYDKMSVFFNFGTTGAMAGMKTYHLDDVTWIGGGGTGGGPGPGSFSTIDFDTMGTTYSLVGFGGVTGSVVTDPTNASNTVGQLDKADTAELWAGATIDIGAPAMSVGTIPIASGMTTMTVRCWSPDANIPVRLKIEDATDPTRSVETEAMITQANTWQTLTFDFSNEAMGTAAVNFTYTYDKASIFFNFGTTGAMAGAKTYYFDDVAFGP